MLTDSSPPPNLFEACNIHKRPTSLINLCTPLTTFTPSNEFWHGLSHQWSELRPWEHDQSSIIPFYYLFLHTFPCAPFLESIVTLHRPPRACNLQNTVCMIIKCSIDQMSVSALVAIVCHSRLSSCSIVACLMHVTMNMINLYNSWYIFSSGVFGSPNFLFCLSK